MANISSNKIGFKNTKYALTALPIVPYLELTGFASDGITWETIEPANTIKGADGLAAVNQKPVLYTGTFTLMANSNSRNTLDIIVQETTPVWGRDLVDYNITLTVLNMVTRMKSVYTGGTIEQADGGDSANMADGMSNKTYRITFTDREIMPF